MHSFVDYNSRQNLITEAKFEQHRTTQQTESKVNNIFAHSSLKLPTTSSPHKVKSSRVHKYPSEGYIMSTTTIPQLPQGQSIHSVYPLHENGGFASASSNQILFTYQTPYTQWTTQTPMSIPQEITMPYHGSLVQDLNQIGNYKPVISEQPYQLPHLVLGQPVQTQSIPRNLQYSTPNFYQQPVLMTYPALKLSEQALVQKEDIHGTHTSSLKRPVAFHSVDDELQNLPSRRPKRTRRKKDYPVPIKTMNKEKASKWQASTQKRATKVSGNLEGKIKKKSKYRGVFWQTREKTWVASIMVKSVKFHLGYFESEVDAAIAYDKEAVRRKGPSAYLNFPEKLEYYTKFAGIEAGKNDSELEAKKKPVRSSKYRGVCWNKCNKAWKACIKIDGRNLHIGYYDDELDAAKAYDYKALQLKGEKAILNFPAMYKTNS